MRLALLFIVVLAAPTFSQEPSAAVTAPVSYPVLSGVGLALDISDGAFYVFKVMPDSVADKSKAVGKGDQILSVQNGDKVVEVQGKPLGEVVSLIHGPVGSTVTLELRAKQQESSVKVTLVREAIPLKGEQLTYRQFIGQPAPALEFSRFDDPAKVELSKYRGEIAVLDFWATWCGACYKPVEDLQALACSHPEWKNRVAFLAVSVDTDDTERERASKIIREKEWTHTTDFSIDPATLHAAGVKFCQC
jgi:thiol-disulfide isomerase/thioredoxin